jgi:hypothetical protein
LVMQCSRESKLDEREKRRDRCCKIVAHLEV